MNAFGVSSQVTTFTLSEFGRTFKPAANAAPTTAGATTRS
jgi:uncharacterized protein (DUF1501 family)